MVSLCAWLQCLPRRKRPKPKKEEKPKLGQEGEDIVVDEQGGLKLKLPPRLAVGSVKAAAWQVGRPIFVSGACLFVTPRSCKMWAGGTLLGLPWPTHNLLDSSVMDILWFWGFWGFGGFWELPRVAHRCPCRQPAPASALCAAWLQSLCPRQCLEGDMGRIWRRLSPGGCCTRRLPTNVGVNMLLHCAALLLVQVLAEAGPAGMRVEEIARRIQKLGLRDLRTSR